MLLKEDENKGIQLIPIESIESLRNKALTVEESRKIFRQSRKEDMELER